MGNPAFLNSSTPTLHFFCGKMAAGKSTLSKKLAGELGAVLICEDPWLSRLYPADIHSFEDYLQRAARLKETLAPHIVDLLRRGNSVVLDFPGNVPRQRQWFRSLFEAAGAHHVLHFVDLPDALCKNQLRQRNIEQPPGSKVMSEEEFDHITAYFVAPSDAEQFNIELHLPALAGLDAETPVA
ncbi:AAA family ATPase [Massilia sp. LXY-6]|uniref:AAA family ATPase n=1 Tax=Massilia sp. LXY-6 TaxID=3379823 RepID=UPI003EE0B057